MRRNTEAILVFGLLSGVSLWIQAGLVSQAAKLLILGLQDQRSVSQSAKSALPKKHVKVNVEFGKIRQAMLWDTLKGLSRKW